MIIMNNDPTITTNVSQFIRFVCFILHRVKCPNQTKIAIACIFPTTHLVTVSLSQCLRNQIIIKERVATVIHEFFAVAT